MDEQELLAMVRALRARGLTPKQVARSLGIPSCVATRLVRQVAREDDATAPERAVLGCWISPGWSEGLTAPAGWPDLPTSDGIGHGLATVLVAREHRHHTVAVACFLVDVYCLGVKDAFGPMVRRSADLSVFVRNVFRAYDAPPLPIAIDIARELVWGGVAYARSLGFEPHADFGRAAVHLGHCVPSGDITFGLDGKPYFIQGEYDDARRVLRTLERSVGGRNFHFLVAVG